MNAYYSPNYAGTLGSSLTIAIYVYMQLRAYSIIIIIKNNACMILAITDDSFCLKDI